MKKIGDMRKSQIMGTAGPGAIVDFPGYSGIVSGIDHWHYKNCVERNDKNFRIFEPNLSKLLGFEYFIQPFSKITKGKEIEIEESFYVPIFPFPTFYYCPKCGKLTQFDNLKYDDKNLVYEAICLKCKEPVVPSRFIVGCLNGHLDDFPYLWWIQKGSNGVPNCEIQDKDIIENYLYMEITGKSAGLESIVIKCKNKNCKKFQTEGKNCFRSLAGCMSKDALKGYSCRGKMPWLTYEDKKDGRKYFRDEYHITQKSCGAPLRTLQRTANNVYYPVKVSALTIPPWSGEIEQFFKDNKDIEKTIDMIKSLPGWHNLFYEKHNIYERFGISIDLFKKVIEMLFNEKEDEVDINSGIKDIIIDEYNAFVCKDSNDKYFKTVTETVPEKYNKYISEVKLVKRLREVSVLRGFRRILPEIDDELKNDPKEGIFDRKDDITPITAYLNQLEWLPAVEMFGEGIFIRLNQSKVNDWSKTVGTRYDNMKKRMKYDVSKGMFSAQYVLLHTLSHLLIRQLAYSCGYNTTSLKEKIYSTYQGDDENKMCGILIYTAATDSDGSLGGLVNEGKKDHLQNLLNEMLQNAYWCSNDPICITSEAQGYNSLNYAACHACSLLPETSCVAMNCLLDRAAITGTPDDRTISFFSEIIEGD